MIKLDKEIINLILLVLTIFIFIISIYIFCEIYSAYSFCKNDNGNFSITNEMVYRCNDTNYYRTSKGFQYNYTINLSQLKINNS